MSAIQLHHGSSHVCVACLVVLQSEEQGFFQHLICCCDIHCYFALGLLSYEQQWPHHINIYSHLKGIKLDGAKVHATHQRPWYWVKPYLLLSLLERAMPAMQTAVTARITSFLQDSILWTCSCPDNFSEYIYIDSTAAAHALEISWTLLILDEHQIVLLWSSAGSCMHGAHRKTNL